jgi:hypothetical protein
MSNSLIVGLEAPIKKFNRPRFFFHDGWKPPPLGRD